jgi:hypothetical protein
LKKAKCFDEDVLEEFGRYQKLLKEEVDRFQKEYDIRLKSVLETFETQKRELDSMLENLRSDVTLWQAKVLQELKTGEAEVTNQLAGSKFRFLTQLELYGRNIQDSRKSIRNGQNNWRWKQNSEFVNSGLM